MHKGGWKPFWAALGAALLVLLPLVGGTVSCPGTASRWAAFWGAFR